jgi:solute carrier family 12 (potassium/chloride transporters), member 8
MIICFTENGIDGWGSGNFAKNLWPDYQDGYTWFRVFGVFFPTITGILSGINMVSGIIFAFLFF